MPQAPTRTTQLAAGLSAMSSWITAQGFAPGSVELRFATGVLWSVGATVTSQGLRMMASLLTARLLGRLGMGELGIVLSTLGAFGVFAGFGLGLTATKYVAELRASDPVRAGRILRLSSRAGLLSSGLVSLVLFALADTLASRVLNAPHLTTELRLGCLLLFLNAINGVQIGALSGFEAYRRIARMEAIRGVVFVPLVIVGVWTFNVRGALVAHIAAAALGYWLSRAAIAQECARSGVAISEGDLRAELVVIRRFAIPAVLTSALVVPVTWLTNAILANQPGGYGELGLLAAANQWQAVLMFVPQAFLRVALPLMSHTGTSSSETNKTYSRAFVLTRSLTLLAVFPAGVLLMFMSSGVMRLYGRDFTGGDAVLIGVIASIMVTAIGSAAGPAIQAKGRVWLGFAQNASWGVMFVGLTLYAAPAWGAAGVAFSMCVSYMFLAVWSFLHVRSELPHGTVRRVIAAVGFVALATAAALTLAPSIRILVALPAAIVATVVTFFALVDEPVRRVVRNGMKAVTMPRRRAPGV